MKSQWFTSVYNKWLFVIFFFFFGSFPVALARSSQAEGIRYVRFSATCHIYACLSDTSDFRSERVIHTWSEGATTFFKPISSANVTQNRSCTSSLYRIVHPMEGIILFIADTGSFSVSYSYLKLFLVLCRNKLFVHHTHTYFLELMSDRYMFATDWYFINVQFTY